MFADLDISSPALHIVIVAVDTASYNVVFVCKTHYDYNADSVAGRLTSRLTLSRSSGNQMLTLCNTMIPRQNPQHRHMVSLHCISPFPIIIMSRSWRISSSNALLKRMTIVGI